MVGSADAIINCLKIIIYLFRLYYVEKCIANVANDLILRVESVLIGSVAVVACSVAVASVLDDLIMTLVVVGSKIDTLVLDI